MPNMHRLVGRIIAALRLQRNHAQDAVARGIGVSHGTLSSWERATRIMPLNKLFRLAEFYGVSPRDLIPDCRGCPRLTGAPGNHEPCTCPLAVACPVVAGTPRQQPAGQSEPSATENPN